MSAMPRWVVAAGAALLMVLLVAAGIWAMRAEGDSIAAGPPGGVDTASSVPSLAPSPSPTPEIITWASGVCAARDGLIGSVIDVAGSLDYDGGDPASVGEQIQQQLPGRLAGVETAAGELGAALGRIPLDYVDAAVSIPMLRERLALLDTAKDEALGHVDAAQQASNPVAAGVEWVRAAAAAKATYDAGVLVKDSLDDLVGSADGDIRAAFATAPGCPGIALG
jgi:hypothetical protein